MKKNNGFTLIELIIVIAILGIISLIAIPNLAGIQQRAQVNADRRTAGQIGKAVRIWQTEYNRNLPDINSMQDPVTNLFIPMSLEYMSGGGFFDGLLDYISVPAVPKSWTDGTGVYYVSAIGENKNKKIMVGISKKLNMSDLEANDLIAANTSTSLTVVLNGTPRNYSISQDKLAYNGGTTAGWCYLEQ